MFNIFPLEKFKWCLNGVSTGSGKSVVISQLAHRLAATNPVIVITINDFLEVQLRENYFSKRTSTPHPVEVWAVTSPKFLSLVFNPGIERRADTILIVDEFDSFDSFDRLRMFLQPSAQKSTTLCVDAMEFFS